MYCLNCGQQLPEGVEYCTKCGAKAGTAKLPVAHVQNAAPLPNAYPSAQKPKSKAPIVVIIVALVVIAVSAGVLTAVLMGGNNGSSSAQATGASSSSQARSTASASSQSAQAAAPSSTASGTSASASPGSASSTEKVSAESVSAQGAAIDSQQVEAAEPEEPEPEPQREAQAQGQPGVDAPFWGVWIGAFTHADLAQDMAADARSKGLPATVLVTTDWSNLNEDFYYVITVGVSTDEATARRLCAQAIDAGFDGAYVKYSGERR